MYIRYRKYCSYSFENLYIFFGFLVLGALADAVVVFVVIFLNKN